MALMRFEDRPFFNSFFNDLFDEDVAINKRRACGCVPAANIVEEDKQFSIEVAAPGLKKDQFKINLDKNLLTISAEVEDKQEEGKEYNRREFSYGSFERSFTVPESVKSDNISADYDNGILRVKLPKKEEEMKVSKEIKVS